MDEDVWRGAAIMACEDSPAYGLLVKVLEERIRNDIGFKNYERWGEFTFLLNSKTNTPLPILLEIIPSVPVNDPRQRNDYVLRIVTSMAQPEDVPLIEKHFKDKGQDVPEILRERLRILKEHQNRNDMVP